MTCSHGVIQGYKNRRVKELFAKCGRGSGKPTGMEPGAAGSASCLVLEGTRLWPIQTPQLFSSFAPVSYSAFFPWRRPQVEPTGSQQTEVKEGSSGFPQSWRPRRKTSGADPSCGAGAAYIRVLLTLM